MKYITVLELWILVHERLILSLLKPWRPNAAFVDSNKKGGLSLNHFQFKFCTHNDFEDSIVGACLTTWQSMFLLG